MADEPHLVGAPAGDRLAGHEHLQRQLAATPLQTTFFRAGHAHAGVFLAIALICQVFVDATDLSGIAEWIARSGAAAAALLLPGGFFLSVAKRGATEPNRLVMLIPAGAVVLAVGLATLGVGSLAAA